MSPGKGYFSIKDLSHLISENKITCSYDGNRRLKAGPEWKSLLKRTASVRKPIVRRIAKIPTLPRPAPPAHQVRTIADKGVHSERLNARSFQRLDDPECHSRGKRPNRLDLFEVNGPHPVISTGQLTGEERLKIDGLTSFRTNKFDISRAINHRPGDVSFQQPGLPEFS